MQWTQWMQFAAEYLAWAAMFDSAISHWSQRAKCLQIKLCSKQLWSTNKNMTHRPHQYKKKHDMTCWPDLTWSDSSQWNLSATEAAEAAEAPTQLNWESAEPWLARSTCEELVRSLWHGDTWHSEKTQDVPRPVQASHMDCDSRPKSFPIDGF